MRCIYKPGETCIQSLVREDDVVEFVNLDYREYLKQHPEFVCIDFDDAMERIRAIQDKSLGILEEITPDKFDDAMNVLPPEKWETVDGVEIFRMMEYTSGTITRHYMRHKRQYFAADYRISTDYQEIARAVRIEVAVIEKIEEAKVWAESHSKQLEAAKRINFLVPCVYVMPDSVAGFHVGWNFAKSGAKPGDMNGMEGEQLIKWVYS